LRGPLKPTRRWRWPATVVLICFVALVIEDVLVRASPHETAMTVNRAGIATSAICAVSGLIGVFQRPKTVALIVCVLGVAIGILALLITVFGELISLGSIFV